MFWSDAMSANATTADGNATPAFVRRAIELSDLNALRVAMLQVTGDPVFARIRVQQEPLNNGSSSITVVRPADRERLIERAQQYLSGKFSPPPPPDRDRARQLLETFVDRPVTEQEFALALEQL